MNAFSTILAFLGIGLLPALASSQDITDLLGGGGQITAPSYEAPVIRRSNDRRRADLFLEADIIPSVTGQNHGRKEIGISANLDMNFICGKFDLRGTFENLLTKEVREEFLEGLLGYAESEIVGSGMELLCQAQPTLCTLLQNHNIAANLKLGYHYDRCQQIQNAVDHAQKRVYASSIEECLKKKQAAGVPLDEALESCRHPQHVRGFGGEALAEFNLADQIRKYADVSEGAGDVLKGISDGVRYTGTSTNSSSNPNALPQLHFRLRNEYAHKLHSAVERSRTQALTHQELNDLTPPGTPPLTLWQVQRLAKLSARVRHQAILSFSSTYAISELTKRIHEAERALEGIMSAPSLDETQKKLLEERVRRLRNARSRYIELLDDQERNQAAQQKINQLINQQYMNDLERRYERARAERRTTRLYATTKAWGQRAKRLAPPPSSLEPSPGGNGFEFSIGEVRD